jgi:hypothetical protein
MQAKKVINDNVMGNGVFDFYDFVQVFGVEHFWVNSFALFSTESHHKILRYMAPKLIFCYKTVLLTLTLF